MKLIFGEPWYKIIGFFGFMVGSIALMIGVPWYCFVKPMLKQNAELRSETKEMVEVVGKAY